MKKLVLLIITTLFIFAVFIACQKEEAPGEVKYESYNGHVVGIKESFVSLESNVSITDYDESGNVSISYTGEEPKFIENKSILVVDVDSIGYLRKVNTVEKNGGQINLTTEQAYFNDVFESNSFKLSTKYYKPNSILKKSSSNIEISKALTDMNGFIHPMKIVYHNAIDEINIKKSVIEDDMNEDFKIIDINKDLSDIDIFGHQGDKVHFYINEGYTKIQSDAVFEFEFDYTGELDPETKIKKSDLKKFVFYLDSNVDFKAKLKLNMQDEYTKNGNPKIFNTQKIALKFMVGPVPVWVTMDCDIYVKYNLVATADLSADWGFKNFHELRIGGTYTKSTDTFDPISDYKPTNQVYPINIQGELELNTRLEIYPRAEVKFYSFFGPYAEIAPYVHGNYSATYQSLFNNNFLAWNSNVNLGLDLRTGAELTFLWGLYDKEIGPVTINCFNDTLWKAPNRISLVSDLPEMIETNSQVELKYKVTDNLGAPVSFIPVSFNVDGNTGHQVEVSNINGEVVFDWNSGYISGKKELTVEIYKSDGTVIQKLDGFIDVVASDFSSKIAIINPDNYRMLNFGYLFSSQDKEGEYMSIPYGEILDKCDWSNSDACWINYGHQSDFIGTILKNAGKEVDYFTSDNMPEINSNDYGLIIIQDPSKTIRRKFPKNIEDNLPDLLEYTTDGDFIDRVLRYYNSGGKLLLVGDAVRLLEDGENRLNFNKTINVEYVQNSVSKNSNLIPSHWFFIRGNPFCCRDRIGNMTYKAEGSSLISDGTIISSVLIDNGIDAGGMVWSDVIYYPKDGVSSLNIQVEGDGEYVLVGSVCSPTVYSVSIDYKLKHFMGFVYNDKRKIHYIGSDSFFDFININHNGSWHCNDSRDINNTVTADGKKLVVTFIDNIMN